MAALRRYLRDIAAEIDSHHQVEDEDVWPLLESVGAERTALAPLTEEHDKLDPLLNRARELVARRQASPELVSVLSELADLLERHITHEERGIFPIIAKHVGVADYERLQQQFRGNLRPGLLAFVVPWVIAHATPDERAALLADAGPLRLVYAVFGPRLRARADLLFGGLTRRDRWRRRIMHIASRRSPLPARIYLSRFF